MTHRMKAYRAISFLFPAPFSRRFLSGMALCFAAATLLSSAAMAGAADEDGKKAFLAQECNKCHSVASQEIEATIKSEKMRGPDLSELEKKPEADWIKQYVLKEVQLNDKNHKAKWEGSEKDLQAIADWVAALE